MKKNGEKWGKIGLFSTFLSFFRSNLIHSLRNSIQIHLFTRTIGGTTRTYGCIRRYVRAEGPCADGCAESSIQCGATYPCWVSVPSVHELRAWCERILKGVYEVNHLAYVYMCVRSGFWLDLGVNSGSIGRSYCVLLHFHLILWKNCSFESNAISFNFNFFSNNCNWEQSSCHIGWFRFK